MVEALGYADEDATRAEAAEHIPKLFATSKTRDLVVLVDGKRPPRGTS